MTAKNAAASPNANTLEKSLTDLALRGVYPHTTVIEGADISVRLRLMRSVCASLICTDGNKGKDGKPCGSCESCKMLGKAAYAVNGDEMFAHPDITVIENTVKNGKAVSVDDIRSVKSDAYTAPVSADCKIYIVQSAERLNAQSQNALLKLLEEPPKNVYFIFSAPSAKILLQTVRSRATVYSAGSLSEGEADSYIKGLFPKASGEFICRTSRLYRYCDGLTIENVSAASLESAYSAADVFFSGGVPELLFSTRKTVDPRDLRLAFEVMSVAARDVLLCKVRKTAADAAVLSDSVLSETPYGAKAASAYYALFSNAAERLAGAANPNAVLSYVTANL